MLEPPAFRVAFVDDEGKTAQARVGADALSDFLDFYGPRVLEVREDWTVPDGR